MKTESDRILNAVLWKIRGPDSNWPARPLWKRRMCRKVERAARGGVSLGWLRKAGSRAIRRRMRETGFARQILRSVPDRNGDDYSFSEYIRPLAVGKPDLQHIVELPGGGCEIYDGERLTAIVGPRFREQRLPADVRDLDDMTMEKYQRLFGYSSPDFREPPRMSYEWAKPADRIAELIPKEWFNEEGKIKQEFSLMAMDILRPNNEPAQALPPEGHSPPVEEIQESLDREGGQVRGREPLPDSKDGG